MIQYVMRTRVSGTKTDAICKEENYNNKSSQSVYIAATQPRVHAQTVPTLLLPLQRLGPLRNLQSLGLQKPQFASHQTFNSHDEIINESTNRSM